MPAPPHESTHESTHEPVHKVAGKWLHIVRQGLSHVIYAPEVGSHVCLRSCPCGPATVDGRGGAGDVIVHNLYTAAWQPARDH